VTVGNVIWHVTMSLDGFIAGPGDAMDWVFEYPAEPNALAEDLIGTTGTVLAGRHSYDVGKRAKRPEMRKVYGGAWTGPQFVLTHEPPEDEDDPTITLLSGDLPAAALAVRPAP
jgi:dihydrofolate reductase